MHCNFCSASITKHQSSMDSLAQGYWLSITRQCLRADKTRDAVPVLLFWLDCLAITRAIAASAPLVGLGLGNDLGSSYDARLQAWLSYAAEVVRHTFAQAVYCTEPYTVFLSED